MSAVAAMLLVSVLIWQTSTAAFTAQTDEDISASTGSITLTDNGSASFNPVLFPGQTDQVCITVTYDQTPATPLASLAAVHVYGSFTDGGTALSADIEIRVDEGCTAGTPVITQDAVANAFDDPSGAHDYASGPGTWVPASDGDTQDYLVYFELPSTTTDSAQGGSVDVTVTWEVQTS